MILDFISEIINLKDIETSLRGKHIIFLIRNLSQMSNATRDRQFISKNIKIYFGIFNQCKGNWRMVGVRLSEHPTFVSNPQYLKAEVYT